MYFTLLPKNLLAESKTPVGHECWRTPHISCLYLVWHQRFRILMCPQSQCMASLHWSSCIHHQKFSSIKKQIIYTLVKQSVAQGPAAWYLQELVRNAESWASSQTFKCCISTRSSGDCYAHTVLRSNDLHCGGLEVTFTYFTILGNGNFLL